MKQLESLELLDYIAKAESQGKSKEEQCLEAGYVLCDGKGANQWQFDEAIDKAKRHAEIIQMGGLHPFLMHGYTKTPVSQKSKKLNQLIEEFSSLASLSYIDDLEEDFLGENFEETGDPDGEIWEYEFGSFDSLADAEKHAVLAPDTDWWIDYFNDEINVWWINYFENREEGAAVTNDELKVATIGIMDDIKEQYGSDLLNKLVVKAIEDAYEGDTRVDLLIAWARGDLLKWIDDWKCFCKSLWRVRQKEYYG